MTKEHFHLDDELLLDERELELQKEDDDELDELDDEELLRELLELLDDDQLDDELDDDALSTQMCMYAYVTHIGLGS
jgi:hypothetical protein